MELWPGLLASNYQPRAIRRHSQNQRILPKATMEPHAVHFFVPLISKSITVAITVAIGSSAAVRVLKYNNNRNNNNNNSNKNHNHEDEYCCCYYHCCCFQVLNTSWWEGATLAYQVDELKRRPGPDWRAAWVEVVRV